jgi:hypothetical protein
MKSCVRCGERKSLDDFPTRKSAMDGRRNECKACTKHYNKAYRAKNRGDLNAAALVWIAANPIKAKASRDRYRKSEAGKTTKKTTRLKMRYGLTPDQWDAAFVAQGSCCAICKTKESGGRAWHTDHDHSTGKFRGILCGKHNIGIGLLGDDPALLDAASHYLSPKDTQIEEHW